jgi:hypothetical protein
MAAFDDSHRLDDAGALALELRSAKKVTAELRKATVAFTAWLLLFYARAAGPDGELTPTQQRQLRTAADAALAALAVDVAARTVAAVLAATRLAIRQEKAILAEYHIDASMLDVVHTDPPLLHAGRDTQQVLERAVADVRHFATIAPVATHAEVQVLAAKAAGTVGRVEQQVRFVTNRAINVTTLEIAKAAAVVEAPVAPTPAAAPEKPVEQGAAVPMETAPAVPQERRSVTPPGMRVVWWSERTACKVCLALSGQVADPNTGLGFDEFATFGKPGSAPDVWPPGMPLMCPPRHPRCRCRIRIIAANDTMLPAALRREAERTVARGWSDHASKAKRLSAADRLLANTVLPKTVKARARADVEAGTFSTRHRPKAPELRTN